jgi:hypothetical protein
MQKRSTKTLERPVGADCNTTTDLAVSIQRFHVFVLRAVLGLLGRDAFESHRLVESDTDRVLGEDRQDQRVEASLLDDVLDVFEECAANPLVPVIGIDIDPVEASDSVLLILRNGFDESNDGVVGDGNEKGSILRIDVVLDEPLGSIPGIYPVVDAIGLEKPTVGCMPGSTGDPLYNLGIIFSGRPDRHCIGHRIMLTQKVESPGVGWLFYLPRGLADR